MDELREAADLGLEQLWPQADEDERLYLRNGLLDAASGRLPDLEAAIGAFGGRLSLEQVRSGTAVEWDTLDAAVLTARRDLEALGFTVGVPAVPCRDELVESDLLGELWQAGLAQQGNARWVEALTSRAFAALNLARLSPILERSILDILANTLSTERLLRQVLIAWLADEGLGDLVRMALWQVPYNEKVVGEAIREQVGGVHPWEWMSDADYVAIASFGQLRRLCENACAGRLPPSVLASIGRSVDRRNQAAHGYAPSLPQYRACLRDTLAARRGLWSILS
jgi:hypothetical protein